MLVIRNRKLRKGLSVLLPILIAAVVGIGALCFREKSYIPISFAVAILSLLLFFCGFERKRTGTGRLVLVAIMVALSVAGRFIPLFKPITALTVLTAVYLGGESGFLVGALSALISNFYFGQGPWTPFQMLAWGIIGLVAGFLSRPLKRHRVLLCLYGVLAGIAYSMIMDVWTVLWTSGGFRLSLYLAAVVTAIPYTVIYALSNLFFLWVFAKPIGQKLERIHRVYGI
ncbi:MAG: ECF transporter S component [Eubacteriales bacterium]